MSTNPPQQTNELDASDGGSPEQQFERLVRACINEARLFKNADKVKLEEEIIALHKALITKQVGEELNMVLEVYRDEYQDIAKENGIVRETPHTIFHQIIETRLEKLRSEHE